MNGNVCLADLRRTNGSGRARLFGALFLAIVIMLLAANQAKGAMQSANSSEAGFKSPQDGSIVEGLQSVIVSAPEYALYYAELGVDGANWQSMQNRGGEFGAKWNSGQVSNGMHRLTARFSTGPGQPTKYAVSIRVYVQNIDN